MKTQAAAIDFELSGQLISLLTMAFLIAFVLLLPNVYAVVTPQNSDVGNFICWVADNFEGNAGRGIGTIGISVLGILALLGKVTWTQALIVGVGCAVLFGAPVLMGQIGGSSINCD